MSISQRQSSILEILNERLYITVEELAKITFTSPSSIRRDLTYLQNNGLVKRSHGGVTLPEPIKGVASFHDRIQKNIREKRLVAKRRQHCCGMGKAFCWTVPVPPVLCFPILQN